MSTVYILGAGASAGYDRSHSGMRCPSAKNFFSVAGSIIRSGPENGPGYQNMALFMKKYFGLSLSRIEEAGMDMQDVLTFLDLEIDYSDDPVEKAMLRRARHEFMDLLALTFHSVLKGPPCPYHAALAAGLRAGDTVISFNYDLLMDTALFQNSPHWQPRTGYGFQAATPGADHAPTGPSDILILKPHGSFNWIACSPCRKIYVLPPNQWEIPARWTSFQSVIGEPEGHELERLIIPPSLKKDVHGSIMQQIWNRSLHALGEADRIVIIGYSLPATDFLVKRLLYRALSHNHNLCELEVVDRNNSGAASPLLNKYRQLLYNSTKTVKLKHDKKNIREYVGFPDIRKNM